MEAEREMIRLKSVRYMQGRLGEELEGRITGITSRGIFVELEEVPVDGFVPRENLPPGFRYQEEAWSWVVPHSGWSLRPGDRVLVQVLRADLRARQIEFALMARAGRGSPSRASRDGRSKGKGRRGGSRIAAHEGLSSDRGGRSGGRRGRSSDRGGRSGGRGGQSSDRGGRSGGRGGQSSDRGGRSGGRGGRAGGKRTRPGGQGGGPRRRGR
jgi:ribonuclease R